MVREELIFIGCSDIAGKIRGKSVPARDLDTRLKRGIGWTPTNVQITCFDAIADSPYGALGDVVMMPDKATLVRAEFGDDLPAETFVIGDIKRLDGSNWECCTRSILAAALARLHDASGLTLNSAFEQEFHFKAMGSPAGNAYSFGGFRARRVYGETLVAAMYDAGLAPDTFLKEYGPDQYEITAGPRPGITGADHALILRELVRITGEHLGQPVSFTPLRDPDGVGNGVHVHMSFLDGERRPATYDPASDTGLSKLAGNFVAGILKYMPAIVALTAPSQVSYLRLSPHRWSAPFNNLGRRDREAGVRICPVSEVSDVPAEAQFNFEFRAADAAASPYLQLAAIVHAGAQGIEEDLPTPEASEEDLSLLSAAELAGRGYRRLPGSLDEALGLFADNPVAPGWFPDGFADIYVKHKRGELAFLEGMAEEEIHKAYEETY
jgi:glutamine synthetase